MLLARVLGPVELRLGDEPASVGRRKLLGLLVFLARREGRAIERAQLVELLWPTFDEARGRQSLRQALSDLRVIMGDGLETEPLVRLDPAAVRLDLEDWMGALDRDDAETALALWRGEFLAGLDDLGGEAWRDWLEGERARVGAMLVTGVDQLAATAALRGDWPLLIRLADRWREAEPLDPRAWTRAIEGLVKLGRTAEAAGRRAEALRLLGTEGVVLPESLAAEMPPAARAGHPLDPRGVLTPELVGRGPELERLLAIWSAVETGAGRAVFVIGPPGSGKSRLCRELAAKVGAGSTRRIVEVAATPGQGATIKRLLGQLSRAPGMAGASPERLARLATIAPELAERFPSLPPGGKPSAYDLAEAVGAIGAEQALLVTVDDLEVGGAEDLAYLLGLAGAIPASVMLVLSGDLKQDPVPAAGGPPNVETIRLLPLDRAAARVLLGSLGPFAPEAIDPLAERLLAESDGNPGAMVEQVRALAESGAVAVDPTGRWILTKPLPELVLPLPAAVRDRTRARLERLHPAARRLLEAAAVIAPEVEPALLERMMGLDGASFERALTGALAERFLRESVGGGRGLEFVSESVRRAVHDLMAPSRRREWHRAAAKALGREQWRAGARARIAEHRAAAGDRSRRWIAGLAAALLLGALAALRLVPGAPLHPGRGVPPGAQVLLADLDDATGEPSLGAAIDAAATVGLQQSRHVVLYPRSRVREVLRRMRRPDTVPGLDEALAREIAERENLAAVVALALAPLDSSYLLTGRVVEPRSGRLLGAGRRLARSREHLVVAVDELLEELRHAMGESADSLRTNRVPLPQVTTASLDALRAYAAGRVAAARGDGVVAVQSWERALALDSAFALAAGALAGWYFGQLDRPRGEWYLARALAHQDRLSPRERLSLEAASARYHGDWRKSVAIERQLAAAFPEPAIWHSIGTTLMRNNQCGEALPALEQAVTLDPTLAGTWVNVATCEQLLDRPLRALEAYHRAEAVDSTILHATNLNHEVGRLLVRLDRRREADSVFRLRLGQPHPLERAGALRSLAYLALEEARPGQAVEHLRAAIEALREDPASLTSIRNRGILAEALFAAGDTTAARAEADSAAAALLAKPQPPIFYFFTGTACLRADLVGRAEALLGAAESQSYRTSEEDLSATRLLRARLLVARGRSAEAIREVRGSSYYDHEAFRLGILADAHRLAGQADSAAAVTRRLAGGFYFGWEAQHEWLRARRAR